MVTVAHGHLQPQGVTSTLPASWERIGYLMEGDQAYRKRRWGVGHLNSHSLCSLEVENDNDLSLVRWVDNFTSFFKTVVTADLSLRLQLFTLARRVLEAATIVVTMRRQRLRPIT
ncbi:hypothetical protein EVAR_38187_1 [Eumeta japonica]|uniref:Uncharacterized protein n=1 Tax=Eumeta variegata TaxID=151549 RepID=A0A4C1WGB1_EUMVA|nr:hypothetical protein EVAR_38187_1 [Eumeta japonica]